jgi:hypothetical protein
MDPDPDPRFQLNTDPIRIRIHNPGYYHIKYIYGILQDLVREIWALEEEDW